MYLLLNNRSLACRPHRVIILFFFGNQFYKHCIQECYNMYHKYIFLKLIYMGIETNLTIDKPSL